MRGLRIVSLILILFCVGIPLAVPPLALSGQRVMGNVLFDELGLVNSWLQSNLTTFENGQVRGAIWYWKWWCEGLQQCEWVGDQSENGTMYLVHFSSLSK